MLKAELLGGVQKSAEIKVPLKGTFGFQGHYKGSFKGSMGFSVKYGGLNIVR